MDVDFLRREFILWKEKILWPEKCACLPRNDKFFIALKKIPVIFIFFEFGKKV